MQQQNSVKRLSEPMREVLELMRRGYFIYAGFNNYAKLAQTHLSYSKKDIKKASIQALTERGLIKGGNEIGPYQLYILTELGKSIKL
jgi:hypothetical protein